MGMKFERTASDSPWQNGKCERANGMVLAILRCLIAGSDLIVNAPTLKALIECVVGKMINNTVSVGQFVSPNQLAGLWDPLDTFFYPGRLFAFKNVPAARKPDTKYECCV